MSVRENLLNFMNLADWFYAAEAGELDRIKEVYLQFVGRVNEKGRTALMLAATLGHTSVCEFLVRFEGRQTTHKGTTALMMAVEMQHVDVVAALAPYESRMRADKAEPAIIRAVRRCCMSALEILLSYEMCYASECLAVAKINRLEEVYKRVDSAINDTFAQIYDVQATVLQPVIVQSNLTSEFQDKNCTLIQGADASLQQEDLITTLTAEVEDLRVVEREYEDLKHVCEAYQERIRELILDNDTLFTDNMSLRRDKEKHLRALKRLGPCPTCKKSQSELQNLMVENTRLSTELSTMKTNSLEVWSRLLMKRSLSDEEIKHFAPLLA